MTSERIAEIKALCEASPWDNVEDFIAAARQIIPELLEALKFNLDFFMPAAPSQDSPPSETTINIPRAGRA